MVSYIVRLLIFFPIVFGAFHLFIFYCWYFRDIAIEIPFLAGSFIFLGMSLKLQRYLTLATPFPLAGLQSLADVKAIMEISAWYAVVIILYILLWTIFDFPDSLKPETWRPLVLGYVLFFAGVFIAPFLTVSAVESARIIYEDLRSVARVMSRIVSVFFIYILIDVVFAFVYRVVSLMYPTSFERPIGDFVDAFYYSTITITTLGYGDIHPTAAATKWLASVEALLGMALLAGVLSTAIAVSLKDRKATADHTSEDDKA